MNLINHLYAIYSTPFIEYERPASNKLSTPLKATQNNEKKVCISSIYRKITEYNGDLQFPVLISSNHTDDENISRTVTSSTITTSSNTIFSPVTGRPRGGGAQRICSVSTTPSATIRTATATVRNAVQRSPPTTPRIKQQQQSRGYTTTSIAPMPACTSAIVSDPVKEIILSLLRPAPKDRVSAKDLLRLAWMKHNN